MEENNEDHDGMKRRGFLKGIAATGLGVGTLGAAANSTYADSDNTHDVDRDDVYLIFGADSSEEDLESWVDAHEDEIAAESEDSTVQVIQYQDVSQLNVNQQGSAVGIAIDGGEATAVQQSDQDNSNTQEGSAESINVDEETNSETFTNVGNAYIVFAEETGCREFNGWVVSEDTYRSEQTAQATVEQTQEVNQFNYSSQSTAVAIAEGGSETEAYQQSAQTNENYQHAETAAVNIGDADDQDAEASVEQSQEVSQLNVSEQGVAIAIAVGSGSIAEAYQVSSQFNLNEQVADATAINFDWTSADQVTASADMTGELSDEKMHRTNEGSSQSNTQEASADVTQVQSVGQENISLQNAAIAVGLDDSNATARQESYQANFNAQVASAEGLNIKDSNCSATAVLNGEDANGDESWAIAYENGEDGATQQVATAEVNQLQFVEQLNINEQQGAIAYASDSCDAVAEQLNFQLNRNVQVAEAGAVNEGSGDDGKDKKEKKKKKD